MEQLGGEHKGRTSSIRQAGAASYQIGAIFGGGFAPLILTSLLAATGRDLWALSVYMMLAAIVTILGGLPGHRGIHSGHGGRWRTRVL